MSVVNTLHANAGSGKELSVNVTSALNAPGPTALMAGQKGRRRDGETAICRQDKLKNMAVIPRAGHIITPKDEANDIAEYGKALF